jgi:hypothetical protein
LGRRPQVRDRLHSSLAFGNHGRGTGRQYGVTWVRRSDTTFGHGLCGLDGIGTVGTAVPGIMLFHEPLSAFRPLFISLIAIGILGLKVIS